MAAELIPATQGSPSHRLRLPPLEDSVGALEEIRYGLAGWPEVGGPLTLESGTWPLHTGELRELMSILELRGLKLMAVESHCPTTLVAAAALGLPTACPPDAPAAASPTPPPSFKPNHGRGSAGGSTPATAPAANPGLLVHRGTLRSGDHLQAEGSVLLLGDLNPGARISAGGHVLVWGRLRGMAHAGRRGDTSARIVALQLRPLQLRIAGAVARGPEERPPEGLAEEARLEEGEIRIEPANPVWPLGE
jgi:septum site-determining protein MinC